VSPLPFPPALSEFISRHITSIEQVEVLLLVCRRRHLTWTTIEVYDAILSTPQSVTRWLEQLVRCGLLMKSYRDGTTVVQYQCCADESLVPQIVLLDDWYRNMPVRVIEAIYAPKPGAAQSFADAFKLKQRDPS
jgi:hypothetical protein